MFAAVEHGPVLCSDSNILCLSWKGRVPKSEKEKPVCRKRYYEEGWLATGNGRGVVGVTFTSSHCRRDRTTPQRINFNLRGHNSEVVLVRWNEPFQKLATCDTDGGIFVWIQYEGRWSVELVNDRGAQVSDFTWSHDGAQALISYRDGFVLVGSVSGQRHWSSEINLESQITCGIWTPDDQQVLFGTADGQVIVMDCHGRMLAHILLHESDGIVCMSWNYPNFLVEDSSESDTDSDDNFPPKVHSMKPLLTVSFTSGDISLMNNYDDLSPTLIRTGLKDVVIQWCSQGDLLAVAGMERSLLPPDPSCPPPVRNAIVKFYNVCGEHIYTLDTPAQRPITTLCWGHRDSRLFLACGPALYVVRVEHCVAGLQLLCQQGIATALREEKDAAKLVIPSRLCSYVTAAFAPTVKPPIPDPNNMRDFVSYPTAANERLHCTMKRTEDNPEVGGPCYTLYLEYLGGLVPILKGRRISKLRPEFVIMDPKTDGKADEVYGNTLISSMIDSCNCSDSSDIELSDDWVGKKSPKISRGSKSPKLSRINIDPRKSPKLSRTTQEISRSPRLPIRKPSIGSPSLTRREFPLDDVTQHNYLAQVTSNIWGTKFKIVGLAAFLPTNLGAVIYKTSLLHLQPRQMTVYLPEVRKISMDYINLPVFSPNVFSEDEDDLPTTGTTGVADDNNPPCTVNIPIAPIHSPAQAMSPTQSIGLVQSLLANQNVQLDVLSNPTASPTGATAGGSDQSQTAQYTVSARYSNPGQIWVVSWWGHPPIIHSKYSRKVTINNNSCSSNINTSSINNSNFNNNNNNNSSNFNNSSFNCINNSSFNSINNFNNNSSNFNSNSFNSINNKFNKTISIFNNSTNTNNNSNFNKTINSSNINSSNNSNSINNNNNNITNSINNNSTNNSINSNFNNSNFSTTINSSNSSRCCSRSSKCNNNSSRSSSTCSNSICSSSSINIFSSSCNNSSNKCKHISSSIFTCSSSYSSNKSKLKCLHRRCHPLSLQLQPGTLQIQIPHLPADMAVERGARGNEHEHLLKIKPSRPAPQLAEGDTVVFSAPLELSKMNPPPPYPGTVAAAASASGSASASAASSAAPGATAGVSSGAPQHGDLCMKKSDFPLYTSGQPPAAVAQYPTPLGYERITTFDSSGNVEEVCRPRTRLICNQNVYTLQGPGSSATLRVTSSSSSSSAEGKKIQLPYTSATLNRLTVPRYSIPSGDPPPYPDPANQNNAAYRSPGQRLDSNLVHATLRRNSREAALKVSQILDQPRPLPPKAKNSGTLAAPYQQKVPTALYTCSQCSSGSIIGGPAPGSTNGIAGGTIIRQDFPPGNGAPHSTVIVHSNSTTALASQSSYSLLSALDGPGAGGGSSRDRTDYINSAFTEDETLNQSLRHLALGGADVSGLVVKRPPPYQWEPATTDEVWVPQERTATLTPTGPPGPHKPPALILGPAQHLDISRLPFILSPKSPTSPSVASFQASAAAAGYQISLQYTPGTAYTGPQLQPIPGSPRPCSSPKEMVAPVPLSQQDATLVIPPGYTANLANLTCCPLPPMYPGGSSCGRLPIPPIALHAPWGTYNPCPPAPGPTVPLPPKASQLAALEKSACAVLAPAAPPPPVPPPPPLPASSLPPAELQGHMGSPEAMAADGGEVFQELLSLTESPAPQRSDKFGKKNRKRADGRQDEAPPPLAEGGKSKKDGRALGDFNTLISSPRLGSRDKKKLKGQKEQQLKAKKLSKAAGNSEFQDSSESEPELFISGDELLNQCQSGKKGWKSKRSLRAASELEEIKCRKANEKEDRGLGSQGFVYIMANKQPLWNEATQVYQLDFGGRVTQESAKNFQIELEGRQVMQFGRIDGNAYILDFQYPFSAVQAFAVALANVTQRLK
ncbi:Tubby-related protein 4 [Merluccius polli]|uniref:Tubby-related protein 4 n=1 Tax=Merluccius polli TaxID=89951 RepID=A0AA47MX31_MERPO|nr:Tubby-related protein 4 [Merluccius polli]